MIALRNVDEKATVIYILSQDSNDQVNMYLKYTP